LSVEVLSASGIGKVVHKLTKHQSKQVQENATKLLNVLKSNVQQKPAAAASTV
jgi:hypothetical protein